MGLRYRSMRAGIVAAGVILMVLGALIFFGSLGSTGTQGLSLTGILSGAGLGAILGFIGFIVFIAGLAASPEPEATSRPDYGSGDDAPRPRYNSPPPQYYTPPAPDPPSAPSSPSQFSPSSVSTVAVATRVTSPRDTASDGLFCPYCGAATKPEYMFCRSCGKEAPRE
jgi:hypothetical protein